MDVCVQVGGGADRLLNLLHAMTWLVHAQHTVMKEKRPFCRLSRISDEERECYPSMVQRTECVMSDQLTRGNEYWYTNPSRHASLPHSECKNYS